MILEYGYAIFSNNFFDVIICCKSVKFIHYGNEYDDMGAVKESDISFSVTLCTVFVCSSVCYLIIREKNC